MRMRAISARRFAAQNMNAQPVADARSVSEMPAGRVPGPRKEPTRQQIENVSGEKPANSARSRVWEQAEAARCARNYRPRSTSPRTHDSLRRLDEADCEVAARPKARSQTGMNRCNRARKLGPSRLLRESATCDRSLRQASRYSRAILAGL